MGRIICYGDSNTYGFDPRDPIEKRYLPADRWPELLAARTGREVINLGLNGRTIPRGNRELDAALSLIGKKLPADCLVIMLGSNDALTMDQPSADRVAARMDAFLSALSPLRERFPALRILLISPPRVQIPLAHVQELFLDLVPKYRRLAEKHRTLFAAAPSWPLPLSADTVHFSADAHHVFAEKLAEHLREAGV